MRGSRVFPYASTLIDKHVTVMCCTGCNGGVRGRGFVVLNNHSGGGWSSIWVKTRQSIAVPYPRWQRIMFAGGVVSEMNGSTTVVDHGWMIIKKVDEPAHHAPPPLPNRNRGSSRSRHAVAARKESRRYLGAVSATSFCGKYTLCQTRARARAAIWARTPLFVPEGVTLLRLKGAAECGPLPWRALLD